MISNKTNALKVFVSYSHDSPEHADRVMDFANHLIGDGIDCILDQYASSPPEGWPRWMVRQIRESDFVLMICTEIYYQRVMGIDKPGTGLGVRWEGNLIYQHIYTTGPNNARFIPVLFKESDVANIPTPLQGGIYYCIDTEDGYEDLYRRITDQPRTIRPKSGKLRHLPPRQRKQDFFAWNVPYGRNPYFTGRESIIEELVKAFSRDSDRASIQAISGLGGTGKTQVVIEYAYRYRDRYSAVFWAGADTTLNLSSGFREIAKMLNLPEKDAQDSKEAVGAVKRWLEGNSDWLLVFDNADDPNLVKEFLPINTKGHILLTSRAHLFQVLGILKPVEIGEMSHQESLEFLLKRTGREEISKAEEVVAEILAQELGFLPLALEQAAAYITGNRVLFQDYLTSYLKRRPELLSESSPLDYSYTESIITTWAMNFEEIEQESAAAADLLQVSAFLYPDSIPFELIKKGASELGPSLSTALSKEGDDRLVINNLMKPLTRYSLIQLDIDAQTYSIHRLVQEVLKHGMESGVSKLWAERAIRALNDAFPKVEEFINCNLCDRLLLQGIEVMTLVEDYGFESEAAGSILNRLGAYLCYIGRYAEAEPLYRRSLAIREKVLGPEHLDVASSINNLASLYYDQGRYAEVEPLYRRSLAIFEKKLGPEHPDVAAIFNNLALLYKNQGMYDKSESLYIRSLAIREKVMGSDHPDLVQNLNNLASLYYDQGRYAEAELLYKRSLAIREKVMGSDHPDVAMILNNLALLYKDQVRYEEAEILYKRSLSIFERALGPEHPYVATILNNLGLIYNNQRNYEEAEPLYRQSLAIWEKTLGPEHLDVAKSLNNFALLCKNQGRYAEAELLYKRSLAIWEMTLGSEHPSVATSLNNLAALYDNQGRYAEAELLYKRSLAIWEMTLGSEHPSVATSLNNLAALYDNQGRYAEAEPLYRRSLAISEKLLGPEHPVTRGIITKLETKQ